MAGRHRGDPPGWPLLLAWVVALGVALVVIVRGDVIADGGRRPQVDVTPATTSSSGCVPRSYVDGDRWWHGCATTPPPAELPATDPFSER